MFGNFLYQGSLKCDTTLSTTMPFRIRTGATTNNIPPIWWEWMMNYRIWEANRKVFLYPENYLDPGLRSSKTTLFKNLESQLLQADITPASVEDAYRQYIEGFSELAKLKYVDAYSCKVNDSLRGEIDVLFLFARTQTEPYSYYYCTREEGVTWTEWQKLTSQLALLILPLFMPSVNCSSFGGT